MPTPDMEFKAVYDRDRDTNVCTGSVRVTTEELAESEALELPAATEGVKQHMRDGLARQLFMWIDEHAPTVLEAEIVAWFMAQKRRGDSNIS